MKKTILLILLSITNIAGIAQTREALAQLISELNASMPISLGLYSGEAKSIALKGNSVVWSITVNDVGNTIKKKILSPEIYKENILESMSIDYMTNKNMNTLYNSIIELGLGLEYHIISENTGDLLSIPISAEEVNKSVHSQPDFKKLLEINVNATKMSLPATTDGMTMTDIELKNGYLVNTFSVSESIIDSLQKNSGIIKEQIKNLIVNGTDATFNMLVFYCYMANYGYSYDLVDPVSNKHVSISLTVEELEKLLSNKQ